MYGDCQVALSSSLGMDNNDIINNASSSSSNINNISNMNMNMNMGMNMFPSDSAQCFSSPPNNSFNFMSTNNLLMPPLAFHSSSYPSYNILTTPKEESDQLINGKLLFDEMESGSGSDQIEALSANDALDNNNIINNSIDQNQKPQSKKKRYHRHTAHQIQEMEA